MSEPRIEADVVYQHEKYGDVLVTGIAKMYQEWDVSGGDEPDSLSASENEVLVFFYDNYDGYGGMNPTPMSQQVDEFAKSVEREHAHEYVNDSDLRED